MSLEAYNAALNGKWITRDEGDGYKPVQIVAVVREDGEYEISIAFASERKAGGYIVRSIDPTESVFYGTREQAQAEADELNQEDETESDDEENEERPPV